MDEPSWDDLYIFERVAHFGSLSEAARKLKLSQPTVSRHIQNLEKQLGYPLFKRHIYGIVLTDEGARLHKLAMDMRAAYSANWSALGDQESSLTGTVRITASVFMAETILPRIIAKMRAEKPEIHFVIVPSNAEESLIFRDVDIAIRLFESMQANVIAKRIGQSEFGCYGAKSYFDQNPRPESMEDLGQHTIIGQDRRKELVNAMGQFGIKETLDLFPVRSDSDTLNWALIKAGAGLGFVQTAIADREPNVTRVLREVKFPTLPVWLAASDTLKFVPRLRYVWDFLEAELSALFGKNLR